MHELTDKIKKVWKSTKDFINKSKDKAFSNYKIAREKYGVKLNVCIILLAILICLLGGYVYGRNTMSKSFVLNQIEQGFKNDDVSRIRNIARCDGKKISKKELQPLMNYFKSDRSIDILMNELKRGVDDSLISIENKKTIFSNSYYLNIDRVNLKFDINYGNTTLFLNGEEKGKTEKDDSVINVSRVLPGVYDITTKTSSKYDTIAYNNTITAMKLDNEYYINVPGVKVSVKSDYPEAEVFLNGVDTNKKVKDFNDIGLFDVNKNNEISLKYDLPWGVVSSENYKIDGNPIININLDIKNKELEKILEEKSDDTIKSIFEALNNKDESMIKADNQEKIYNDFVKKEFILKNEYVLDDYNIEVDKSDVSKKDDYYHANVYVTLKYSVSKNILGFNITPKTYERKIFLSLDYKDNDWKVRDVLIVE